MPHRIMIKHASLHRGFSDAQDIVVVVDAFRAFATACVVLAQSPADYFVVADSATASWLASRHSNAILLGKPEIGATLAYDLPNSPSRAAMVDLGGRTIIHRTSAGTRGVLLATRSSCVLAAAFGNVRATARYIHHLRPCSVTIVATGHEGRTPAIEDRLCSRCIAAAIRGEAFDLSPYNRELREESGRYLVGGPSDEYPAADLAMCLDVDRYDFAIQANLYSGYASLVSA
jgi:2-phosphosulfolactate phosphatase